MRFIPFHCVLFRSLTLQHPYERATMTVSRHRRGVAHTQIIGGSATNPRVAGKMMTVTPCVIAKTCGAVPLPAHESFRRPLSTEYAIPNAARQWDRGCSRPPRRDRPYILSTCDKTLGKRVLCNPVSPACRRALPGARELPCDDRATLPPRRANDTHSRHS